MTPQSNRSSKHYLNAGIDHPFGFQLKAVQVLIKGHAAFNSETERAFRVAQSYQTVEPLPAVVVGIGVRRRRTHPHSRDG